MGGDYGLVVIWDVAGHEVALVGAGHAYEDSFEFFLRLICISCWDDQTGLKDFLLWADPDELNPEEQRVRVDYAAALAALASHIRPEAQVSSEVVAAAVALAGLTNDVGAGIDVIREQATSAA